MHLAENVSPVTTELHSYLTMPLTTGLLAGLLTGPPAGFRELKLEEPTYNARAVPKLDLGKLYDFFKGTEFLNRIAKTRTDGGPKTTEAIEEAFIAYCDRLKARKVVYQYISHQSPFDNDFKGQSNCKGRAKGFLQLMAVMGVARDCLDLIVVDGGEESKIAKRGSHSIASESVFCVPNSSSGDYASNAVTARLENGRLTFARTDREPFANHYAARVKIASAGFKYWDPLFSRGYKNGMSDYFDSYRREGSLSAFGLDCYVAPDQPRRRLYRVPAQFNSTMARDKAFQAALEQQGGLESTPRLFVIIDEVDWGAEPPHKHPAVVRHIMRSLEASVRGA